MAASLCVQAACTSNPAQHVHWAVWICNGQSGAVSCHLRCPDHVQLGSMQNPVATAAKLLFSCAFCGAMSCNSGCLAAAYGSMHT